MKIDSDMLYGLCPCGSGSKFKFCCWPKCRDSIAPDMTNAAIVQTVRCTAAGVYRRTDIAEADEACNKGMAEYKAGNDKTARKFFCEARALDPKMWAAWNNEAMCAWEMGEVEAAYDLQKNGVEAYPERNTFGVACLAIYSHVLGRDSEAYDWISRALSDKLPLSRDAVLQVCRALAIFRRHREIVDYAVASRMDDDELVAFFKGTALANLGETEKALPAFEIAGLGPYGPIADHYADTLRGKAFPFAAYDGDWPYFWVGSYLPAKWFDEDMKAGRDPFARYPNAAVDAIEVLISDEKRKPSEMLKLIEDRNELGMSKLRESLKVLADDEEYDDVNEDSSDSEPEDGELPEGVTAVKDDGLVMFGRKPPKWRMEYEPSKDGTPQDDATAIIDGFARPFVERYCTMDEHEHSDDFEIAVLQTRYRRDDHVYDCPSVELGLYRDLWNILRKRLEEFFEYFSDAVYSCEVRFDTGFGGPILTLEDAEGGLVELFMVSQPDHYGKDD